MNRADRQALLIGALIGAVIAIPGGWLLNPHLDPLRAALGITRVAPPTPAGDTAPASAPARPLPMPVLAVPPPRVTPTLAAPPVEAGARQLVAASVDEPEAATPTTPAATAEPTPISAAPSVTTTTKESDEQGPSTDPPPPPRTRAPGDPAPSVDPGPEPTAGPAPSREPDPDPPVTGGPTSDPEEPSTSAVQRGDVPDGPTSGDQPG